MADRPRLPPGPAERIDRATIIHFTFDGRTIEAHPGDTIGSALTASGVRVLGRSFKYHRPRGLMCGAGRCPNCLVDVDGIPSVRACTAPVAGGMRVRHQNAWPSLRLDVMSLAGRFSRFLPIGFYYKVFHRPRFMWPLFEWFLRRAAGIGRIDVTARPDLHPRTRHLHCDVAVVGAGPAGCLAAIEAARAGARVILVDEASEPGGHLRVLAGATAGDERLAGSAGHEAAARLVALLAAEANITALWGATAYGLYEGALLGVSQGSTHCRVRARRVVLATGAAERLALFERNDLPGVMLGTGILRLARLYGARAGERAVVLTDDWHGWRVAAELAGAGVDVVALVDERAGAGDPSAGAAPSLEGSGIEVLRGATVVSAEGSGRVRAVRVRTPAGERSLACDLVAVSVRPEPVTALLAHAGGARRYDERIGDFVPDRVPESVHVAGDIEGFRDEAYAHASGVLAGRSTALALGFGSEAAVAAARVDLDRARTAAERRLGPVAPVDASEGGKRFVCLCEDVTTKELAHGVAEGFDDPEMMKRYSTLTMGPCQGKMCAGLAARVEASLTGRDVGAVGLTTARPPYQPVSLAVLAGPHLDLVRRTALHDRHETLGATWIDMGDWKRPLHYGSVDDECRAVREAAGIIDVSTLGKIDVRGPDAGEFLDWLHPNRFSDLRIGRVRYRAMLDESGVVLDDGTVARLGPDRFFVTTGTGTIDAIDQWLRWWLAGGERDVAVTNVTAQYAAMNLAGPRARDVLRAVTAADVSREAMPYLAAVEADVAGVPAVILRIGFVGEIGFEIHVPADYGMHVWDALLEAGRTHGIRPFAVEAQRVLRLEKQHLIVGQDTDALSGPLEAGLGWLVKADKPDWIGRTAVLASIADGAAPCLVGFELDQRVVPAEGAGVVREGRLVGRVTSAKWSAHLGRTIGMAWLTEGPLTDGTPIVIRVDRDTVVAHLVRKPFYDPDGARLRG